MYTIDRITDHKKIREKDKSITYKYLTYWVDYTEPTWEPAINIPDQLTRDYCAAKRNEQRTSSL